MRAAIDCRYVRERPSGIGAYVEAIASRLPALAPRDNFEFWTHPRAAARTSFANVTTTLVRAEANGPGTLAWPSRLAALHDADVFHAPFNVLGRGIECATVVTVHDVMWIVAPHLAEASAPLRAVRGAFYGAGIRHALCTATSLVVPTSATASDVVAIEPQARHRIAVIPHGIDARFSPVPRDDARKFAVQHTGFDAPFFLAIGQAAPYKNHGAVVEAFAAAGLDAFHLVVVERLGSSRELIHRARELGVEARAHVFGASSEKDVVTLMRAASAFVQFSRFEGFGMPMLEAMACGTPVLASDTAALVEVAGGAALHVPLVIAELAQAMRRVAGDAGLASELGARGIERARAFSWDASAALHLDVLRDAAATGARSRAGQSARWTSV